MANDIGREAHTYVFLRERLLEEHGALREDTDALEDTLDGISNFKEAVEWFVDSLADDEVTIAALQVRAATMAKRMTRLKKAYERKKEVLRDALLKVGKNNVDHPEFTVYLSKVAAKVKVQNQEELPEEYTYTVDVPEKKVRMAELETAIIENGEDIPGAILIPEHKDLRIRRG